MKTLADKVQAYLADPWKSFKLPNRKFVNVLEDGYAKERTILRRSRRFTLSNDFIAQAIKAATVNPYDLIRRIPLANLPFDAVWIEWDQQHRVTLQHQQGTSIGPPDSNTDNLGGFLIRRMSKDEPEFWSATGYYDHPKHGVGSSFVQQVLGPWRMQDVSSQGPKDRLTLETHMREFVFTGWGYQFNNPQIVENPMLVDGMLKIGGTLPDPLIVNPISQNQDYLDLEGEYLTFYKNMISLTQENARETMGDLRWLVTVLSMINIVPIEYKYVPAVGRFTHKFKTMDYLDTSIVTIHAGRKKVINILDKEARRIERHMRRHEVRGFFRVLYRGTAREKRVWVKEHMRGDASIGFVTHAYEVKK